MSAKRLLTDDVHDAHTLSNRPHESSDTPDELFQMLRNAGSRVRKSVTEGYRTAPSAFSKAQSTGSIFSSMNDTMCDVYANADTSRRGSSPAATRKRARSVTDGDSEDNSRPCDDSTTVHVPPGGQSDSISNRQIKPLRANRRGFTQTQSLPVGALAFAASPPSNESTRSPPIDEEDDWSQASQPDFQPMSFD